MATKVEGLLWVGGLEGITHSRDQPPAQRESTRHEAREAHEEQKVDHRAQRTHTNADA